MKGLRTRELRVVLWTAIILLTASASVLAANEGTCSNASLQGTYAFTESGNIVGIGPVAVGGAFEADGQGNLVTSDTVSLNGEISEEHLNFTYEVKSDCSGKASSAPGQEPAHFNFVLIRDGAEAMGIHTDSGTTLLLSAKKLSGKGNGGDSDQKP